VELQHQASEGKRESRVSVVASAGGIDASPPTLAESTVICHDLATSAPVLRVEGVPEVKVEVKLPVEALIILVLTSAVWAYVHANPRLETLTVPETLVVAAVVAGAVYSVRWLATRLLVRFSRKT
jgi:hypothetical protein